jgi:thioredoxin 1
MKIIDFWAEWCAPCKMMDPVIEEIKKEYPHIEIEKVNVDEDSSKAQNFDIGTIPTFVLVNEEGIEIKRIKGAMPKHRFVNELGISK